MRYYINIIILCTLFFSKEIYSKDSTVFKKGWLVYLGNQVILFSEKNDTLKCKDFICRVNDTGIRVTNFHIVEKFYFISKKKAVEIISDSNGNRYYSNDTLNVIPVYYNYKDNGLLNADISLFEIRRNNIDRRCLYFVFPNIENLEIKVVSAKYDRKIKRILTNGKNKTLPFTH